MVQLTPEQFEVKEQIVNVKGMLLVSAGAGCGKTFLARRIVEALGNVKVLYTAFNKAIVVEGQSTFNSSVVDCKTLHALAYKFTKPSGEIRGTNYRDLPKDLSYNQKYRVLQAIEEFFVSASSDMGEYFEDHFKTEKQKETLAHAAIDVIEQMLDKKLSWSFSFLLKYFHLMLKENPEICQYDLVILDEINDTTAVALEIFKLIQAPRKLGLGEPHQAIYAFMNLVNGFEELEGVPIYPLTNSFRCSEKIASIVEKFMKANISEDFKFSGTDSPVQNNKSLFCTMTNASIVRELQYKIENNEDFNLLRKPSDIFACPLAVLSASSGKEVYQTKYKYLHDVFENWTDDPKGYKTFFAYLLEELNDQEIHSAIRLLLSLSRRGINLFSLYNDVKHYRQKGNHTIATVFTAKGLEFEKVILADEFNTIVSDIKRRGGVETEEDLVAFRCYYVAASRAGLYLENATALLL